MRVKIQFSLLIFTCTGIFIAYLYFMFISLTWLSAKSSFLENGPCAKLAPRSTILITFAPRRKIIPKTFL